MKRTELKSKTGFKPPTKPMKRTPFKQGKSERQMERDARYYPIRDAYMEAHPCCEICGGIAIDPHHMAGKIGENYFRHLKAVCRPCHTQIHSDTEQARELGYLFTDSPRRVGE